MERLNGNEQIQLIQLVSSEGFKVLTKIMQSECERFREALLNADESKAEQVLAAHVMAKSAIQFFQGVIEFINEEVSLHRGQNRPAPNKEAAEIQAVLSGINFEEEF